MLAVPLWLLYELGIIVAGWVVKNRPAAEAESYTPLSDAELDAELDRIEEEQNRAG
jgi:sec-independent protein translocase protein TatC